MAAHPETQPREPFSLVIVGHVDHGKSTVIGRLLADTHSLPEGKLEQVRLQCQRSARPFEYAFLLDALKAEQAQGITIDAARCFFKTAKRDVLVNDAPGHIEFLKNMVTGAARAEAALLVIDAKEGIRENSKRHGFLMSLLGLGSLAVLVNKMDLVGWSQQAFDSIREEYLAFLKPLGVRPVAFIPISALGGDNLASRSLAAPWYHGPTVLEQVDAFERPQGRESLAFRMPVQDIYKFTGEGDDRRILAGTIEAGSIRVGEQVAFYPSAKRSRLASIEAFHAPARQSLGAGEAAGFTLSTQVYIKPGELMVKASDPAPRVGRRFRATVFWMGRAPLVPGRSYKLKLAAARVAVRLVEIRKVLDAAATGQLEAAKRQVDRHDVAEVVLEAVRPLAFDLHQEHFATGRFVLVDQVDIAGCGIILEQLDGQESLAAGQGRQREAAWDHGLVDPAARAARFGHSGRLVLLAGLDGEGNQALAKQVEQALFARGCNSYYLGLGSQGQGLEANQGAMALSPAEQVDRLGEQARLMADAGLLLVAALPNLDDADLESLQALQAPHELFVVVVGENPFSRVKPSLALAPGLPPAEALKQVLAGLMQGGVLGAASI
jgi:bifunctional enzyme CysN/CysC